MVYEFSGGRIAGTVFVHKAAGAAAAAGLWAPARSGMSIPELRPS